MLVNAIVIAMSIGTASNLAQGLRRPVTLRDLTAPEQRLSAGCALSPATWVRLDGNTVRGPNLAGLPIPTNPWAGTDTAVIATIRERIDGPFLTPDGPPFTRGESARYRLRLADGIDEAYAAIYQEHESNVVVVYALRFSSAERPVDRPNDTRPSENPRIIRVAIGSIFAVVHGDGGKCFQAVGAYLKSLAN